MNRRDAIATMMVVAAVGQTSAVRATEAVTTADKARRLGAPMLPSDKLRALLSAISTLDSRDTALLFMTGTCYAGFAGDHLPAPLFGVSMLVAGHVFTAEGRYRQTSNQLVLFTDLDSGRVIDTWHNPYIDETVHVFHGHNGPQDIEFDLAKLDLAVNDRSGGRVQANLDIDWVRTGPLARTEISVRSKRKNPLDPVKWSREYSGDTLDVTEWSEWVIPSNSLDRVASKASIPCVGSTQRFANWYPWMLMGQRSGYLFTRLTGQKLGRAEELPSEFLQYASAHYPEYLQAPPTWTGRFVDVMSVFMAERSPVDSAPRDSQ